MILLFFGDWFRELNTPEQIFWGISLIFSILFLIQFVVSLFGFDFDADIEADVGDADAGGGTNFDADFGLFSVRSIIAFFTFFGWTGVYLLNAGKSIGSTVFLSSLSGMAAMVLVAYMLYQFAKLSQNGNVDLDTTLFQTGTVYLPIPANKEGIGKINVLVGNSIREMRAITAGDHIPNGKKVRVIEVMKENVLLVEPSEELLLERENSPN